MLTKGALQCHYSAVVDRVVIWHDNAKVAIIPNIQVSLIEFLKFFLFWVPGIIMEGWRPFIEMAFVARGVI